MMTRVLIVDDLPEALAMLEHAVRLAFESVHCAQADGVAAAKRRIQAETFDLALVDLHLGDGQGVEVIAALAERQPACTVVVASIFDDDDHLFRALQAGAQGYLLKDRAADRLAGQLRGIAQGQPPLSPAVARRLIRHFQQGAGPAVAAALTALTAPAAASRPVDPPAVGGFLPVAAAPRSGVPPAPPAPAEPLTPREREVLGLLAHGVYIGDIARVLGISRHTVGDHVKNIYRKLNISSRAEAALEARGMGLA
jgi:DNA-binding NarL/FixJ family response regulator